MPHNHRMFSHHQHTHSSYSNSYSSLSDDSGVQEFRKEIKNRQKQLAAERNVNSVKFERAESPVCQGCCGPSPGSSRYSWSSGATGG